MTTLFYFSLFLLSLAFIRFVVVLINYFTRPFLPLGKMECQSMVSVLIPPWSLCDTLSLLHGDLLAQEYSNMEILVYKPSLGVGAVSIVTQWALRDDRIVIIEGAPLPQGGMDVGHAYSQLTQAARGDYLVFLNDHVTLSPKLIGNAVSYMERKRLWILRIFPRQVIKTLIEQLVVPNVYWLLLSLWPLKISFWSNRMSWVSAAGQFLMFKAQPFREQSWCELPQLAGVGNKAQGSATFLSNFTMATLIGGNDIACSPYHNHIDPQRGLAKYICRFFGGSCMAMTTYTMLVTIAPVAVLYGLPFPLAFMYFFAIISSRMMVSALAGQSIYRNIIFWPLQHTVFIVQVVRAMLLTRGGQWLCER